MGRENTLATILYLEHHTRAEYIDMIQKTHLKAYLSPIHNDEGCKEHMHLMIFFDGLKSEKQIKEVIEQVGGVGKEKIYSNKGYARYLLKTPRLLHWEQKHMISIHSFMLISFFTYFRGSIPCPVKRLFVIFWLS